jgi:hypothetical protein
MDAENHLNSYGKKRNMFAKYVNTYNIYYKNLLKDPEIYIFLPPIENPKSVFGHL